MSQHGFLRVAAASPVVAVASCRTNAERTLDLVQLASESGVDVIVFPEMGLTSYTCHDLFHHSTLLDAASAALAQLLADCAPRFEGIVIVGLPVLSDGMVFNCAAVGQGGKLLGVVPKSYLPHYKEFYDARYFQPAANARSWMVKLAGQLAPFGKDLLFECDNIPGLVLGVEICEDLWMPVPPSSLQAVAGANIIFNLSASNETVGKADYRRQLVVGQSARCIAGYVYASAGPGESSTDLVFGGHCLVAENGTLLAESPRFQRSGHFTIADIDLDRLTRDRMTSIGFHDSKNVPTPEFRRFSFTLPAVERMPDLVRVVDPHPFVPSDPAQRTERCQEIFATQVCGLAKRLEHIGRPPVAIGVSGGLDSTLALLVACKTFDELGVSRVNIRALTMPGYGTTSRTRGNAQHLMSVLGVSAREIDIRSLCLEEMRAFGHKPFGITLDGHTPQTLAELLRHLPADRRQDLVFENIQARVRTNLLMNTGFVIGTGDVSELALGWCTYNADHMSMYNPNVSIPKTLVRYLVEWAAETEFEGAARSTLLDVAATEISPELLPTAADGTSVQSTEASVGPYELHDFFLYHFLRWGCPPEKILFLASHARFRQEYTPDVVRQWLRVFLQRFFMNQFKRSCLPDGPKVGSVSVSPRGDWRMSSDAAAQAWLERLQ